MGRSRNVAAFGMGLTVALACSIPAPPLRADRVQQAPGTQLFREGVELVVSDVTVTCPKGVPVEDLTAADFAITVDGNPRRIAALQLVRASAYVQSNRTSSPAVPEGPASATPPIRKRTFFLVVDRDRIPAGGGRSHLEAANRFVDRLGPYDEVGLWTLPVGRRKVRDRDDLKRQLLNSVGTCRGSCSASGLQLDWDSTTGPPRLITSEGFFRAMSRLEDLVSGLASVEGAKHVVVITGGNAVAPDDWRIVQRVGRVAAAAGVHVHVFQPWNVLEGISVSEDSQPPAEQLNQNQTAEANLATITGGVVVTSAQGEAGFKVLGSALSAWYVIGFEPEPIDRDGKPHALRFAVPGRAGLVVRGRQQFVISPPRKAAAPR